MDWNTLLGVVVGGLIATIGSIISNRFQARERDKDRGEARREAKIQLEVELVKNSIKIVNDALDKNLTSVQTLDTAFFHSSLIDYKIKKGFLTKEEGDKQRVLITDTGIKVLDESAVFDIVALSHAYSLGKEFVSEYRNYLDAVDKFSDSVKYPNARNLEDLDSKDYDKDLYYKVIESAGNIQQLLREKLISIRDTYA
jgi:hypothetical protein